jgi:hypothetical protein
MKATRERTRTLVNQAVRQAFSEITSLVVKPCEPAQARRRAQGSVQWSWVDVVDPVAGTLVVVMPMELAGEVTRTVLGDGAGAAPPDLVRETQCELTGMIAGGVLSALEPGAAKPRIGAPRSGPGMPDVRQGDWMGQTFAVGGSWLAVFLQAPDLLQREPRPAAIEDEAEPDTATVVRADPLTRAVVRAVHQIPSDEIEVEEPGAFAPPAPQAPQAPLRRSSARLPVAQPVQGPGQAGHAPAERQPAPAPPPAAEQPQPRSSTSQRRGVVRTIHGLRHADGEPPAGSPAPAPAARPPLAAAEADESTRPWYRVPVVRADDLAIPETIGNYRVLARVAEGGMGVVLKGEHTALDRLVAIKLMRPALAGNHAFATRFMREARIAAALDHPNLVTVYDASQEGGQLFMALRWMPGGDLTALLQRQGPLPERRAVAMFTALGAAVGYLAGKGLLHRDIKPSNILLDEDGTARLGDLGLARESGDAGLAADAFDRMGTPSYMPPEQLRGDADLDVRSDLYSLALTLYVALTCRQPLQGADQGRTIANVLNELPPDPRTFNPAVSEGMARLLRKALDKDRDRRFASANEFIEALAIAEQGGTDNELSASGVSWFGKLFAKPK